DQDLLELLRRTAHETGAKYQTLLNQLLRNTLTGHKQGILDRLNRLEKAVFKEKKAA
ncbi:MAG: hypothetical protein HY541_05890, partial [Deltaproteobacteria bacterium]|nr:hypothetical protein [Deltaproteobacteria bacterium]